MLGSAHLAVLDQQKATVLSPTIFISHISKLIYIWPSITVRQDLAPETLISGDIY